MQLIKLEALKARKNTIFITIFCLCIGTICISAYFFYADEQNFVVEQKQEARIMLRAIEDSSLINEDITTEKNLYMKILNVTTWQETYEILNEIDQLFLDAPILVEKNKSDLPYDYQTNIEVRRYNTLYAISPDDVSSGKFLNDIFHGSFNYLLPIFIYFISLCIFSIEYEGKTITYLYTLPYKLAYIVLSKLFMIICMSFISIVIPILLMYLITSLLYGVSNSHMLIEVSKQYAQITLHQGNFLTINHVLAYIAFFIGMDILVISSTVCLLSTISKNHITASIFIGICFTYCILRKFLIPISNILSSQMNFSFQCLSGCALILLGIVGSIQYVKKGSIL